MAKLIPAKCSSVSYVKKYSDVFLAVLLRAFNMVCVYGHTPRGEIQLRSISKTLLVHPPPDTHFKPESINILLKLLPWKGFLPTLAVTVWNPLEGLVRWLSG